LITSGAIAISFKLWPHQTVGNLMHTHTDLPSDHPHLQNAHQQTDGFRHAHTFVIDDLHHHWPTHG
ncbi:MAG: MFS transporter, partial [Alphaproteobacteria bacterium]